MNKMIGRTALLAMIAVAALMAVPADAATVPSKTAADQSLVERQADLDTINGFVEIDQVSAILAEHGFTDEEVDQRLAALSDEQIASLAENIDQIQAAGLTTSQWTYVLIGAVVVLLILVL
ncbi:MAG: PA2779 family protein [Acidobacteria bacterium]|nr:PA2779 family protein [Acidobacteriota bacterium]